MPYVRGVTFTENDTPAEIVRKLNEELLRLERIINKLEEQIRVLAGTRG